MTTKTKKELEFLGNQVIEKVNKKKNPSITLPIRGLSNIFYDEKSKTLKLGKKTQKRTFFNLGQAKRFLQTIEVASISYKLLKGKKHASLRDVFYMAKRTIPNTKTNLVDEQTESDHAIEDLELITKFPRETLNINANKNGSVAGKVIIEDKGDIIDWSKLGSGGWSIPSNVEDIKFEKVKAKYVLYMEKAAVWERLHEDRYWDKQDCIILSSQGQATRGIRRLLKRLSKEFKLPIYILCDNDPWGIYIYSVIKYGSMALAHESDRLAIPDVRYLGITCDDIENYKLQKHFIKLKESDVARIKQMSEYEWFKNNRAWQRQLRLMKANKAKVEIQALSSRGISFISEKYLPEKIKKKDFID